MLIKTFSIALIFIVILFAGACKKKEEQPAPKVIGSQHMFNPDKLSQASPHDEMKPKAKKDIVVPDSVKGKWSSVKLVFEDRTSKKKTEYTVRINSEFDIPNTVLKISVGEFLPDFKIEGSTITSGSNELGNPAVKIEIFEKGTGIFDGWLYSKYPDIHAFEHQKYGLTLKEGIKK
ncbi:MAG: DUF2155 domain-containing protein [Thermodesulfovibrio sp.]|nr:DUF2155 domain-containing protein [Thermodesulfovibrio sp.]